MRQASVVLAFVFALTHFAFPEVGKWAWRFLLLTSAAYCLASSSKNALRTPILLWIAALLVQTVSWAVSHFHSPEIAESSLKIHRLSHSFSFILIAWALKESKDSWMYFWLFAALGAIITVWTQGGGWQELAHGIQGNRTDLGFTNEQHTGLVLGVIFIGLLIFSRKWLQFERASPLVRWLLLGGALAAIFTAIMITQTRSILLGLGTAFATITMALMFRKLSTRRGMISKAGPIVATVMVLCTFMGFSLIALIDCWQDELPTIEAIAEGNSSKIAMDSVGIRVTGWIEAFSWIEQQPVVGWGGNAKKHVIQKSDTFPSNLKPRFHHLHNSYIELLVNYGVLGLLVVLALYYWIFRTCRSAFKKQLIPSETYYFCMTFLVFWITVNQFESFMFYPSGRFVFTVVVSGIMGMIWQQQRATNASDYSKRSYRS